jgi:quercetin dioxygenase-like cupin family protein
VWTPWRLPGFEARDTGIGTATSGVASVRVARPVGGADGQVTSHTSDILFTFVMSGTLTLHGDGQGAHELSEGDAYVIPPHMKTALSDCSGDLQLLEVSLPADFETHFADRR